jgi:hypothetical protein
LRDADYWRAAVKKILCIASLAVLPLWAEVPDINEGEGDRRIYRTVDEHGRPVFTDAPDHRRPAEPLEIREQNTITIVPSRPSGWSEPSRPVQQAPAFKVAISSPAHEETFRNPQSITVKAGVSPRMPPGGQMRLMDNGVAVEGMTLEWPIRGEHRLVVQVLNAEGEVVAESDEVIVYVHRASLLFKKP